MVVGTRDSSQAIHPSAYLEGLSQDEDVRLRDRESLVHGGIYWSAGGDPPGHKDQGDLLYSVVLHADRHSIMCMCMRSDESLP